MNTFEELQERVLSQPLAERGRLAIAVLDSLDDEPMDGPVGQEWTQEVLSRSAAYSRGELQAVDWRVALKDIEDDLNQMAQS